eukprot:scaffold13341_cov101-Isochrysis_galbana.AAC.13
MPVAECGLSAGPTSRAAQLCAVAKAEPDGAAPGANGTLALRGGLPGLSSARPRALSGRGTRPVGPARAAAAVRAGSAAVLACRWRAAPRPARPSHGRGIHPRPGWTTTNQSPWLARAPGDSWTDRAAALSPCRRPRPPRSAVPSAARRPAPLLLPGNRRRR